MIQQKHKKTCFENWLYFSFSQLMKPNETKRNMVMNITCQLTILKVIFFFFFVFFYSYHYYYYFFFIFLSTKATKKRNYDNETNRRKIINKILNEAERERMKNVEFKTLF